MPHVTFKAPLQVLLPEAAELGRQHQTQGIESVYNVNDGTNSLCITKSTGGAFKIFALIGWKDYGFDFYGKRITFQLALPNELPINLQEYGKLGYVTDYSGRRNSVVTRDRFHSVEGLKKTTLSYPLYSDGVSCTKDVAEKLLKNGPDDLDKPYAVITTTCWAVTNNGEDHYQRSLFISGGGWGLLTQASAVAGRDQDDCCSPEYRFKAEKIRLTNALPLKVIRPDELIVGADAGELTLSVSPAIIPPVTLSKAQLSRDSEMGEEIGRLYAAIMKGSKRTQDRLNTLPPS